MTRFTIVILLNFVSLPLPEHLKTIYCSFCFKMRFFLCKYQQLIYTAINGFAEFKNIKILQINADPIWVLFTALRFAKLRLLIFARELYVPKPNRLWKKMKDKFNYNGVIYKIRRSQRCTFGVIISED